MSARARDLIRAAIDGAEDIRWQRQVAMRAGITQKHLSQIMRGHVALTPAIAVALESAIGVSAEDLMVAEVKYLVASVRPATDEGTREPTPSELPVAPRLGVGDEHDDHPANHLEDRDEH
jgi:plasmid maintenance system antidote protein VapI